MSWQRTSTQNALRHSTPLEQRAPLKFDDVMSLMIVPLMHECCACRTDGYWHGRHSCWPRRGGRRTRLQAQRTCRLLLCRRRYYRSPVCCLGLSAVLRTSRRRKGLSIALSAVPVSWNTCAAHAGSVSAEPARALCKPSHVGYVKGAVTTATSTSRSASRSGHSVLTRLRVHCKLPGTENKSL